MHIANVRGRFTLLAEGGGIDVETASRGAFSADPQAVFAQWTAFRRWAEHVREAEIVPVADGDLGAPAPAPAQVFGIGLTSFIDGIGTLRNRCTAAA